MYFNSQVFNALRTGFMRVCLIFATYQPIYFTAFEVDSMVEEKFPYISQIIFWYINAEYHILE